MSNLLKKLLHPIEQLQTIRGVELPVGLEFLQLIVTGPPGAGKTYYINQIRGWPNEGYIDLTADKWWKHQSLIYRPREVHLGLPFAGIDESLTVFDKEWIEAEQPLALEPHRIMIPPSGDSLFRTDWKTKYIFEFIIPDAKTVYSRRMARHSEGYFPVDENLSLEMVTLQTEIYREVALYLHRAGMQVYIREDLYSRPMRIIETGDATTPMWLLPKTERSGHTFSKGNWKNLFLPKKVTNWLTITDQLQDIVTQSRIAHDGKTFELHLGKQQLHFHPEIPLGIKKKNVEKNWLIFSPHSCSAKNILGFARLCVGESVVIGRENQLYSELFDLDDSVAQRQVQITNRYGDLIITPLSSGSGIRIIRVDDQDIRERVEAHRHEALISLRDIYGGSIDILEKESAQKLLEEANSIIENDVHALANRFGKAGGIIQIPDSVTPLIIGDLHGQVNNLLKILSENYLLECLYANTAAIVILGDAVHSEVAGEMEDMESSILMMDLILKLKTFFPENIFYLRGNHDSFDPELSKNGISQGIVMQQQLFDLRGARYIKEMKRLYDSLPYIAFNSYFYCCHAAPPMKKTTFNKLVDIHTNPGLIREITTNRVKRPHYLNGYNKKDVRRFRKTLNMPKGSPFIVGHTPMDPFGSYWLNAGNIKNHHVIYSGHQEKPFALLIEGRQLIPLEFPKEPVTKLINKLS